MDDFGVKYFNKVDVDHLLQAIKNYYEILVDWDRKNYCGLSIEWDYDGGYVDVSMPGYAVKALAKYQHPTSSLSYVRSWFSAKKNIRQLYRGGF